MCVLINGAEEGEPEPRQATRGAATSPWGHRGGREGGDTVLRPC